MQGYRIYALTKGVYLKRVPYGASQDGDLATAVDENLTSLGVDGVDADTISKALENGEGSGFLLTESVPESFPGTCWVEIDGEGAAHLTIAPPLGKGRCVDEFDVKSELEMAGAGEFFLFEDELSMQLKRSPDAKEPVSFKVAERRDAEVTVEVPPDGLEAYLTIKRPRGGAEVTVDTVMAALGESKVTHGILNEKIEKIVADKEEVTKETVAEGKPPENGEDGRIEYTFDAFMEHIGPRISDKDLADYKDLGLFESVRAGDVVAKRVPPTEGTEGIDVCGKAIATVPGKDIQLPVGKNTEVGGDENTLVASIEGQPKLAGGKVIIDEILTVRSDIDFGTGSIDFVGSVVVQGFIQSGFSVKAGGDIGCMDVVEGAEIEAAGNVTLRWGIKGQNKAVIKAGGDVTAKFIESARVEAGGSIIVEDYIIHSDTRAANEIRCVGSKGRIDGGRVSAGSAVNCKILGSEMGAKTIVEVGINPPLREEFIRLKQRLDEIGPKLKVISGTLNQLEELKSKGSVSEKKVQLHERMLDSLEPLKREYEEGLKRLLEIKGLLKAASKGKIVASEASHPGVVITIGNISRAMSDTFKAVAFTSDGSEIVLKISES